MKALILAAGVGRRLGEQGENQPKCLLQFDHKTLLERHLVALRQCQVDQVVMAIGYQAESIRAELDALGENDWVTTVYNPAYTQGSLVSLWCLREHLSTGQDVILMDADVLYDSRLLQRLRQTSIPNCFLLDREFEPGLEPVKLCVQAERLIEFRKQLAEGLTYDFAGESVGFFRFSGQITERLLTHVEHYIAKGYDETPYEEAIRDLLLQSPEAFGYEDITGLPWIEIDFPEDVDRARLQILPRLQDE